MSMRSLRALLTAPARWLGQLIRRSRGGPPEAGVREPRRPRPTLPAAAVALAEPNIRLRRWLRLTNPDK
jgi:hypothetical protein